MNKLKDIFDNQKAGLVANLEIAMNGSPSWKVLIDIKGLYRSVTGEDLDDFDRVLDAADKVESWLANEASAAPSRLETIRLTSTDPDDLTLRAARLLGEADHIFHPAGTPAAILDRARADAARHIADAPPADPPPGLSLWLER